MDTKGIRRALIALVALTSVVGAGAQEEAATGEAAGSVDIVVGADATFQLTSGEAYDTLNRFSTKEYASFRYDSEHFGLIMEMSANNDGKYSAESANLPGGSFGNIYVLMDNGGVRASLGDLSLTGGRLRSYDVIDSPYSLFLNANGNSAMTMKLAYDDGLFFYSSQWIGLNVDSSMVTEAWGPPSTYTGFPDRGANIKTYGIRLGEMRFGVQDAAVYSKKYFDVEYFLNPLPQYFIQYTKTTSGRPWYVDTNENNMLGVFWDWVRPGEFSANAQFLMDDFNLYALGIGHHNPWKAAATVGGRYETDAGSFGLYAAGATQFTFNPIGMDAGDEATSAYGYSYYPDTRFDISSGDGEWASIGIEDNNIGYKYGENNFAIQAEWADSYWGFDFGAAVEFRLAGANSPANPWGDWHTYPNGGTRWLDDDVLEKRFLFGAEASRKLGAFTLYGNVKAGVAFDALKLRLSYELDDVTNVATPGEETPLEHMIMLWAPEDGNTLPIFSFTVGASYALP